jgi:flavodoxin I
MDRIGLFFGSDTGYTETIAKKIVELWGDDVVEVHDIKDAVPADLEGYTQLILGTSTWNDGELVVGWYDFYPQVDDMDFTGKTVAVFGLGDQSGYGEYFVDGIGILAQKVKERGAKLIGKWPTEGYDFIESKAVENDVFLGLALDDMNQSELTDERLDKWLEQIKQEFLS